PGHGGDQPEIVEDAGPELRGDAADLREDLVGHGAERAHLVLERSADLAGEAGQLELERGDGLAQLIVDLSRDAGALLLARVLDARRQAAQLGVEVVALDD